MTLLAVERIKLFSTRSPWWCAVVALGLTIGLTTLMASFDKETAMSVGQTQSAYQFGLVVVMVMAALSVTTEYRFGTIKATFQAAPNRVAVLSAKAAVVAALALIIGEVAAFGSWGVAQLIAPSPGLAITTAEQWRQVAGVGPVFAIAAILSVGVGILLRQTGGAVAVLLIWPLLLETLISVVPTVGEHVRNWLPFRMASHFLSSGGAADMPLTPWWALAYFAAVALAVLAIAIATAHRRDA